MNLILLFCLFLTEFIKLFAEVRFGIALGIIDDISYEQLGALLVEAMPATLTLGVEPPPKNQTEEDALRARVVRERVFGDT